MKTAYCPQSHEKLSTASTGGDHVPGHQYRDVDVVVSRRGDRYRVHVVESWGSAQGYDEEHGRREVVGRGDSIRHAINDARKRAEDCGITIEYLVQALSMSEDEAEEAVYSAAR